MPVSQLISHSLPSFFRLTPKSILTWFQAGLFRVVGKITTEPLQLLDAADQMIKAFVHPKWAGFSDFCVDLACGKSLPRMKQLAESPRMIGFYEEMHMVRHDHERIEFVTFLIEVLEGSGNHLAN